MTWRVFLELVEMKAKTASLFPILLGAGYSWYHDHHIEWFYLILFLIAAFLFNMSVDILDNYFDYLNASDSHDYKEHVNIIGREQLSLSFIRRLIILLIALSAFIGIYLTIKVGWPLLLLGLISFAIGIFYSAGPLPLSSLPLGEVASGLTMGYMITLICVYINTFSTFHWSLTTLSAIFLVALPNTLWISNLMLANNICDLEEDEINQRFTLVHYLGIHTSKRLFISKNIIALLAIVISVLLQLSPASVLVTLILTPLIHKWSRQFRNTPIKQTTFPYAVKILAVGSFIYTFSYLLGSII